MAKKSAENKDIKSDEELMSGHPAGEAGANPNDKPGERGEPGTNVPETETVVIAGQEFLVAKDTAAAITSLRTSHEEELVTARRTQTSDVLPPKPDGEDSQGEDLDTIWFTNPKEAKRLISDEIKAELRAEYSQARSTDNFWRDFYISNPELQADKDIVEATLNGNYGSLKDLKSGVAADKLADLVKTKILDVTKRFGGGSKKTRTDTLEGSSTPTDQGTPGPEESSEDKNMPKSLTDAIKQRRMAKRLPQTSTRGAA